MKMCMHVWELCCFSCVWAQAFLVFFFGCHLYDTKRWQVVLTDGDFWLVDVLQRAINNSVKPCLCVYHLIVQPYQDPWALANVEAKQAVKELKSLAFSIVTARTKEEVLSALTALVHMEDQLASKKNGNAVGLAAAEKLAHVRCSLTAKLRLFAGTHYRDRAHLDDVATSRKEISLPLPQSCCVQEQHVRGCKF